MTPPDKFWYAIYTKSRNEKQASLILNKAGIETYLPLVKTLKQWSDRKKWVEEPLFKSYLFVHILQDQYFEVLNVPAIVRYITFEGKAVQVPAQQINAIKQYLDKEEFVSDDNNDFKIGHTVEIFRGSLKGLIGNLIEIKGKQKVQIEIESVGKSIVLTIPKASLKILK